MVVADKQIFNLMNTNGRRSDVLNALKIYLEVLIELSQTYPTESWDSYPNSTKQILFYEKALELSKDVFKVHKNYDSFIDTIGSDYSKLLEKNKEWISTKLHQYAGVIDESIEQRARHYTSNLVKIGFADADRNITKPGYSFFNNKVQRDEIETLLPIDDTNIVLVRQLLKLRIFSEADNNGNRYFYSPFLMAISILLRDEIIDKSDFSLIIQGLSPYINDVIKDKIANGNIEINGLTQYINDIDIEVPNEISSSDELTKEQIRKYFKTSKESDKVSQIYYDFYVTLKNFIKAPNKDNYLELIKALEDNSSYLKKAFGYGKNIFDMGNRAKRFTVDEFIEANDEHELLTANNFNQAFYKAYMISKNADGIREYSDTTIRLLSATGLFKFRNLPELEFKQLIELLFNKYNLNQSIFGEMTDEEYKKYESDTNCFLFQNLSVTEVLGYCEDDNISTMNDILRFLNVSNVAEAKTALVTKKNTEFTSYIKEKYPKDKVIDLLKLFSDRKNDNKIKKEVNDAASVPTIYEYIVAIAWHYVSNFDYDLYESMNLTLNADFEPVIHAGGGAGDIVINYDDSIVMLEVTLMNKQAQKRGEWEPVLRHSLNLKAENMNKETITFFIADELDTNTINIWRAVAAAPLESTTNHTTVEGVIIMPITNLVLVEFLQKNIYKNKIIQMTKESFAMVPKITDLNWHMDILEKIKT